MNRIREIAKLKRVSTSPDPSLVVIYGVCAEETGLLLDITSDTVFLPQLHKPLKPYY